jgi:hypothetical protein
MVVGTLALLVIASQVLADNKEKDAPKKTYKYVSAVNAGEEIPKEELKDWILTTDGTKGTLKKGAEVLLVANYKIDMKERPGRSTWTSPKERTRARWSRASSRSRTAR